MLIPTALLQKSKKSHGECGETMVSIFNGYQNVNALHTHIYTSASSQSKRAHNAEYRDRSTQKTEIHIIKGVRVTVCSFHSARNNFERKRYVSQREQKTQEDVI